ncbi:unnamed protein product, partial [Ectocarpus sp. 8 AP-2014]
ADAAQRASKDEGSGGRTARVCASESRAREGGRQSGRSVLDDWRRAGRRGRSGGGLDGCGGSGRCWCSRGKRVVPQGLRLRGGNEEK